MTLPHCAADPRDCECERQGAIGAGCLAGVLGRLESDPLTGDRVRVYDRLPCWLDAERVCKKRTAVPAHPPRCHCGRALDNGHRVCPACLAGQRGRDYSQGRTCGRCGKAICDDSKTGRCMACYRARRTVAAQLKMG